MDLIYADIINNTIVDRGVMHNYSLDLSFGQDENDFVLKVPVSFHKLEANQVIYVPGTEYGGVIDSIAIDTESKIVTYSGRTFHGILEGKKLYPFKNADYLIYSGEANYVLGQILERLSLIPSSKNEMYVRPNGAFIKASTEDSGIYINKFVVSSDSGNYASGYAFIRDMLYQFGAKPMIINGVIEAVPYLDYSADFDWLYESMQFEAKANYNSVNHLHCMGQGDLSKRYTIDLYLNTDGGILPYSRANVQSDADYYTDLAKMENSPIAEVRNALKTIKENMVTGVNEICEIYDYPNAQTTYHYILQTSKPANWASIIDSDGNYGFQSAFVLDQAKTDENEADYKQVTKPDKETRYSMLQSQPYDWATNYNAYYYQDAQGYHHVPTGQYTLLTSGTAPYNWTNAFNEYYVYSNGSYKHVSEFSELRPLTAQPGDWAVLYSAYYNADGTHVAGYTPAQTYTQYTGGQPGDWATNYGSYYYSDGHGGYVAVSGESQTDYPLLQNKPGDWDSNWGSYYIQRTKYVDAGTSGKTPSKGEGVQAAVMVPVTYYQTLAEYAKDLNKKSFKWNAKQIKGKVRYRHTYTVAPAFTKYSPLYTKDVMTVQAPTFVANTYYYKYSGAPTYTANTYYQYHDAPTFVRGQYLEAYEYQPIPTWVAGVYYTRNEDHYEQLVQGGLKKLQELQSKSELSIDLSEGLTEYDINDRVAASDELTGIGAIAKVIQKIVKIDRGITTLSYKVGRE